MPLKSHLFQGNSRLEACLVQDSMHVVPGATGPHVRDIQVALRHLDGAEISLAEQIAGVYGPETAAAVLAYKRKREIINRSYQNTADNIIGKMTMAALDKEMLEQQVVPNRNSRHSCPKIGGGTAAVARQPQAANGLTLLAMEQMTSKPVEIG